jgi:hypothetical protein
VRRTGPRGGGRGCSHPGPRGTTANASDASFGVIAAAVHALVVPVATPPEGEPSQAHRYDHPHDDGCTLELARVLGHPRAWPSERHRASTRTVGGQPVGLEDLTRVCASTGPVSAALDTLTARHAA